MYAIIEQQKDGTFYALVGRDQKNGYGGIETVLNSAYKGRFFKTLSAAEKSTAKFIGK